MVLMMGKTKVAYKQLLRFVNATIRDWRPKVISDFEASFLAAVEEELDVNNQHGCWFHFCKVSQFLTLIFKFFVCENKYKILSL